MAADLYVIEPLPPEEAPGAPRAQGGARPLVEHLITVGVWAAIAAAAIEGVLHFVNAASFDTRQLDVNEEHNVFTWANSGVILVCSLIACLAVFLGARHRRELLGLALCTAFISFDETVVLHENIAFAILGAVGLGDVYDSVLWPILYLPLLVTTAVLLLRVAESVPPRARRCLLVGLGLLAFALVLEIASTPWSTDRNLVHTIEGGFEEMAELAGWILIATGLASLLAFPFERRSRIARAQSIVK